MMYWAAQIMCGMKNRKFIIFFTVVAMVIIVTVFYMFDDVLRPIVDIISRGNIFRSEDIAEQTNQKTIPRLIQPTLISRCQGCNVILISIDTLGAKHLGLYGYDNSTSPFLDRYSRERGIVFENAIAQAPWTLPSHAAMLTSLYPQDLGLWTPFDALSPDAKTIAEVLRDYEFTTQAFSYGPFVQPEWGLDQGFDGFSGSFAIKDWDDVPKIFDESTEWLQEHSRNTPFFLFIRSFHVHGPYTPSKEIMQELGGEEVSEVHIGDVVTANTRKEGIQSEEVLWFRSAYDGEIRELDKRLEKFFQELDILGILDNTVVIFTADHGEEFGEHGIVGSHLALYNETIHVPLIFFLPDSEGTFVKDVVEIRSLPPSILDIIGLEPESSFRAESIFSNSSGNLEKIVARSVQALEREEVFNTIEDLHALLDEFGKTIFSNPREEEWNDPVLYSARSERWHIIYDKDGDVELYDLEADREEQHNLYLEWDTLFPSDQDDVRALFKDLGIAEP